MMTRLFAPYWLVFASAVLTASCRHAPPPVPAAQTIGDADDSFMKHPCQDLTVDEFGWRLDSLGPTRFRVVPEMKSVEARTFLQRHYSARDRQLYMEMELTASGSDMRQWAAGLTAALRVECDVNERLATVLVGRRDFDYETTVLWHDIGDGSQLRVTARARTLADLQRLRGTLFTMQFPTGG
ncbi:MAG: hypothetical protein U0132_22240 [Gemmatimonadaceae bacterium]